MKNIICYDSGGNHITALAQWDRDIYIYLQETFITESHKIHFFNNLEEVAYVVESTYNNGILTAKIPNILLTQPYEIIGYVFDETENGSGRSIARFRVNVRARPQPSDTIYDSTNDYISYYEILENYQSFAAKLALKADNLFFNIKDEKLYLMSEGKIIGDGVTIATSGGVKTINNIAPDENGNFLLDEILFTAFVEEGFIHPVYKNDAAMFVNEDGKVFVFDIDKQKGSIANITVNGVSPDEKGDISLEEVLFAAFEEEGVIQPIYDNDMSSFTDEDGVMFVYDTVNQNVKAVGGQANITVNGIEPDAEGNISLPVYRGAYEEE